MTKILKEHFLKHKINESLTVLAAGFIRSRGGFSADQMPPPEVADLMRIKCRPPKLRI